MFDQLKSLLRRSSNNLTNGLGKRQSSSQVNGNNNNNLPHHDDIPTEHVVKEETDSLANEIPNYTGLVNYQLVEKLGDGAFSNVYKAIDKETNRMVAVKVVRKLELSQTQKASVLKEVQLMRTIQHPSIVKLYRFIETNEHYFLILEICEGGELFHRIVRLTYFSEDLSRHCIRQVAEGIRYLHEEKGIVHRDIKPENLLFEPIPFMERVSPLPPQQPEDGDEPKEDEGEFVEGLGGGGIGQVKIADFGLSKVVWDQSTRTPCGTVGYTAPEIVRDERYSKSVDMWALGCVLYTLLCGFPPFYDESIQVLTEKVAKGQYTFLSPWWDTISESAKDLISHLLCIDPNERYTIEQFFEHPWMKETTKVATTQEKQKTLNYADEEEEEEETPDSSTTATTTTTDTDDEIKTDAGPTASSMTPSAPRNIPNATTTTTTAPPNSGRRLFSPNITSMKEMFDVSYAVQRITEEKSRRKNNNNNNETSSRSMFANAIMARATGANTVTSATTEDEDTKHDKEILDQRLRRQNQNEEQVEEARKQLDKTLAIREATCSSQFAPPPSQEEGNKLLAKTKAGAQQKSTVTMTTNKMFELSMDNATLLGRRRKPTFSEDGSSSPLARAPSST
ncbi:kinase-like domain-containing protein [Phascolomyces articulosus]|uniref:Kinase-like domain-containing protein n=1 Tax=Phascolomyces articulosus TaxID=60185 RepID=A0AAD5K1P9_9FUNG|nr:kinase-like domain-containing protein [Phascolomyces articulosus]